MTETKFKNFHDAMEAIREDNPELDFKTDLHNCLANMRQAIYLLERGVVIDQKSFSDRLLRPALQLMELIDEA